jgi:hypothetical protein
MSLDARANQKCKNKLMHLKESCRNPLEQLERDAEEKLPDELFVTWLILRNRRDGIVE